MSEKDERCGRGERIARKGRASPPGASRPWTNQANSSVYATVVPSKLTALILRFAIRSFRAEERPALWLYTVTMSRRDHLRNPRVGRPTVSPPIPAHRSSFEIGIRADGSYLGAVTRAR